MHSHYKNISKENDVSKMAEWKILALIPPQKHRFSNGLRTKCLYEGYRIQLIICNTPGNKKIEISGTIAGKENNLNLTASALPAS